MKSGASIKEFECGTQTSIAHKRRQPGAVAYPATVINIMISDVVGDDMDIIASGPFVAIPARMLNLAILQKYTLTGTIAHTIIEHLEKGHM